MLDKEQSEAIAEALLLPTQQARKAAEIRNEEQRCKLVAQQRFAKFGFVGFVIGGAISYGLYGKLFPVGLLGIGIGFALNFYITRRAP
jgi:hypothetical protein